MYKRQGYIRNDLKPECDKDSQQDPAPGCKMKFQKRLSTSVRTISGNRNARRTAVELFGGFARDVISSLQSSFFRSLIERMPDVMKKDILIALNSCKLEYFLEKDHQILRVYQGAITKIFKDKKDLPKDSRPVISEGKNYFKDTLESPPPTAYYKIFDLITPKDESVDDTSIQRSAR